MKKRRFSILLIFLSVLTLLFSGCQIDNFAYVNPDGSTIDYNTHSGTVSYNESEEVSIPDEEIVEDNDIEDSEITEDSEEDDDSEDISEDSDIEESDNNVSDETEEPEDTGLTVSEDGEYTSKDEVALFIHLYNHLPGNYITKKEAHTKDGEYHHTKSVYRC